MVFGRYFSRRRRFPNRRRRFSTKRRSKFKRRGIQKSYNTGAYKLRIDVPASSNVAGVLDMNWSTTNTTDVVGGSTVLPEWTSLSALYDQYRVIGIKLHWIPHFPFNSSAATNYVPIYVTCDFDSPTEPQTVATILQYSRVAVKNAFMPWTYYIKLPAVFTSTQNQTVVGKFGWLDIANPPDIGNIAVVAEGLNVSTTYARVMATYYVIFKGRR